MAKKAKSGQLMSNEYYPFILILPLLLLPPFFRGLFFDTESLVAYMYTSLVLVAYVLYKKEHFKFSFNLMEISFVGFVLAWFLSISVAYDLREAVGDALRNLNYLVIFLLISSTAVTIKHMRMAQHTIFLAGLGVALAGIGTAYGTFSFNGAYVDGLINTTLQYHNAAAIYLMACGIIGLYMAASTPNANYRYVITGLNFLILITAFGAGSRGAMLMGPIAYAFYLIGVPGGLRGKSFISLISIGIPFALLSTKILDFSSATGWLFLFIGMAFAAGIHLGLDKLIGKATIRVSPKTVWVTLAVIFFIAGFTVFAFSEQILPQGISERLHNFDLKQHSVQERFYFYKDAVEVIKDHPLLGTGGGGWNAVYRQYQGYLYHSTEVHNHPLQVWVETGTLGFVFFTLLLLSGLISLVRIVRSSIDAEYKAVAWTSACVALALVLHSLIDFPLSEGAVSILLWSQFGLARAVQKQLPEMPQARFNFKPTVRKFVGLAVGIAFFAMSFSLFIGDRYAIAAATALRGGNLADGRASLESATKFDPINANIRVQLSQVYAYEASQNRNFYLSGRAYDQAKKATELNKANSEYHWMAAQAAAGIQNVDAMVKYGERGIELAPLVMPGYENLAVTYLNAAKTLIADGQKAEAEELLKKIIDMPVRFEEIMAQHNDMEKRFWRGPKLEPTERFNQIKTEAEKLLSTL